VRPDDVLISADRQGSVTSTRAMNFMLENNPDMFMLWMGGDNLSNLLSPT
jgi:conjugal transfer ATP-binding protein TraC